MAVKDMQTIRQLTSIWLSANPNIWVSAVGLCDALDLQPFYATNIERALRSMYVRKDIHRRRRQDRQVVEYCVHPPQQKKVPRLKGFAAKVALPDEIREALANGADLVISVSGGKDSDVMTDLLLQMRAFFGWSGSVHLIHADLGRAEWPQTRQYVERRAEHLGVPLAVVHHPYGDLLDGIRRRASRRPGAPPFPSAAARWCTSDWKRSIISKWIRNTFPDNRTVVSAMGLRAEESPSRARRPVVSLRKDSCAPNKNRLVYDWLPIHHFSLSEVWRVVGYSLSELESIQRRVRTVRTLGEDIFAYIDRLGFQAHPAYALGNERLSCALCIFGSLGDLRNGREYNPVAYQEMVDIENETGFSFRQNLWLRDLDGTQPASVDEPVQLELPCM